MDYQTILGDKGTRVSRGQKQRLLLARALYRRPRILVLDEATSYLDMANEQQVNEAIRRCNVTRIIVAHRPKTIKCAERILVLQDGVIQELSRPKGEPPKVVTGNGLSLVSDGEQAMPPAASNDHR